MAVDVPKAALETISKILSGATPSKARADYWGGGIPWVSAKDLKKHRLSDAEDHITSAGLENGSKLAPANATLILTRGMTLLNDVPICRLACDVAFNQDIKAIVPRPQIDPTYLTYALLASKPELLSMVELAGHGTGRLPTDLLKALEIPLLSKGEQRAIAHILGTLDDKIELNQRMNETLEGIAKVIFKSWFVDFDPVRARAEGREISLPRHIADFFPNSFVDSELGEIPKGWSVGSFAETIEIIGGGTPNTSVPEYWNGEIPWFSVVDVPRDSDVWAVDTEKKITKAGVENSSTRMLPEGTTIITARGTVGKIALVGIPMAMNQSCYGLRGNVGKNGFFTYFATRGLLSSFRQHAHGSVFDTITRDTFAGLAVVVPPEHIIETFEEMVHSTLERMRCAIIESRTLTAMRSTLLPKLISGELRVKDTERFMEAI